MGTYGPNPRAQLSGTTFRAKYTNYPCCGHVTPHLVLQVIDDVESSKPVTQTTVQANCSAPSACARVMLGSSRDAHSTASTGQRAVGQATPEAFSAEFTVLPLDDALPLAQWVHVRATFTASMRRSFTSAVEPDEPRDTKRRRY